MLSDGKLTVCLNIVFDYKQGFPMIALDFLWNDRHYLSN